MNKKALTLFCFILFLLFLTNFKKNDYINHEIKIKDIKTENKAEVNPIINKLNVQNNKIDSIYYSNNSMLVDGIGLKSSIFYEKDLNFRMISTSFLGKETDVGSNKNQFWFWSKRMKPPVLFYSDHENLHKTRLKTPFNPNWMIQILGISKIDDFDNCFYYKNYLAVTVEDKNNYNEKITKLQLIDINKNCFFGHYIYNSKDELVISAEVESYYCVNGIYLPKKIQINWQEENVKIRWDLSSPIINEKIKAELWKMPNYSKKIDLNGY